MKKILFITSESLQDPKRGTPIRILNFIKQLQKAHEVVVSSPAIDQGFSDKYRAYPSGSVWSKISYFKKIITSEKIEIVLTATDIDIGLPVWLKFFAGVKIGMDLHGLYAAEMYFQGHMGCLKSRLLQLKINFLIRFYDLVFVVSPKLIEYYGPRLKKGVVIYGGVTEKEFYNGPHNNPPIFTIGYTGNAKPYQGIDYLLNTAAEIKRKNIFPFRLNMIMSSGRGEIEDTLSRLELTDVADLHFKASHEEVPALIASSNVLVIARPSVDMTEYAYPSKLPEYLATGIPVITTKVGPVEELFKDEDCIIVIPPVEVEKNLEQSLLELYQLSQEDRRAIGQRAIAFVRSRLTWDILGQTINQSLEQL